MRQFLYLKSFKKHSLQMGFFVFFTLTLGPTVGYGQVIRPVLFKELLLEDSCGLNPSQLEGIAAAFKDRLLSDATAAELMQKIRFYLEEQGVVVSKVVFLASQSKGGEIYLKIRSSLCDPVRAASLRQLIHTTTLKGVTQLDSAPFIEKLKTFENKPFNGRQLKALMADIRSAYTQASLPRPYVFFSRKQLEGGALTLMVDER